MDNEKIRIIIADDEPVTKMDLRELLTSAGYQVVAEASFWVADLILHDVLCLEVGFRAADLPTLREYQEYQRMDL